MGKAMRRSSQMLLILLALFAFGVFSGYLYSQNPDSCNYDTGSRGYLQSSQCWWESRLCNSVYGLGCEHDTCSACPGGQEVEAWYCQDPYVCGFYPWCGGC